MQRPHPNARLAWVRSDTPLRSWAVVAVDMNAAAERAAAAAAAVAERDDPDAEPDPELEAEPYAAAAAAAEHDADSAARAGQPAALADWDESAAGQRRAEARAAVRT